MTFTERLSSADSQTSAFSRRSMLGKTVAIALAAATTKLPPKPPVPSKYPLPEFNIGDLIASDWENDENEYAPQSATDFGEILGLRWAEDEPWLASKNGWVYFVRWTHSTIGAYTAYPCYDGEPSRECDLRLVDPT